MTLEDMTSASEIIYDVVDQEANIIVGTVVDNLWRVKFKLLLLQLASTLINL